MVSKQGERIEVEAGILRVKYPHASDSTISYAARQTIEIRDNEGMGRIKPAQAEHMIEDLDSDLENSDRAGSLRGIDESAVVRATEIEETALDSGRY